jgi:hypothetical protein
MASLIQCDRSTADDRRPNGSGSLASVPLMMLHISDFVPGWQRSRAANHVWIKAYHVYGMVGIFEELIRFMEL